MTKNELIALFENRLAEKLSNEERLERMLNRLNSKNNVDQAVTSVNNAKLNNVIQTMEEEPDSGEFNDEFITKTKEIINNLEKMKGEVATPEARKAIDDEIEAKTTSLVVTLISSKLHKVRENYLAANRYEDVKNGKYVNEVLNKLSPEAYEIFANNTVNVLRNLPNNVKQEILSYEE